MDRRDFFKVFLAVPLLSPMILGTKRLDSPSCLYLISDQPQDHLPFLLQELHRRGLPEMRRFDFCSPHPQHREITHALLSSGLVPSKGYNMPCLRFSHVSLAQKTLPSFTLLQDGRICDIRSSRLSARWASMRSSAPASSTLTLVSFSGPPRPPASSHQLHVYQDGKRVGSLFLGSVASKMFAIKTGAVLVRVQDGRAWVESAPCRHKICCSSPPVSLPGERILCAPSRFFITVSGAGPVDTVIG